MFVLVPTGDLSSQSSDTLMSLRTTPIPQVVSAGSAGVRYPAGSLGCVVVQYVRPVPSELWRGRLSPFSLLRGGWMFGLVRRVFRKRPQGVTRTLSAAKQGGAERPGDGCPCVGAEETCGVAACYLVAWCLSRIRV